MKHMLQTKFGYLESNIVVLEDGESSCSYGGQQDGDLE